MINKVFENTARKLLNSHSSSSLLLLQEHRSRLQYSENNAQAYHFKMFLKCTLSLIR